MLKVNTEPGHPYWYPEECEVVHNVHIGSRNSEQDYGLYDKMIQTWVVIGSCEECIQALELTKDYVHGSGNVSFGDLERVLELEDFQLGSDGDFVYDPCYICDYTTCDGCKVHNAKNVDTILGEAQRLGMVAARKRWCVPEHIFVIVERKLERTESGKRAEVTAVEKVCTENAVAALR